MRNCILAYFTISLLLILAVCSYGQQKKASQPAFHTNPLLAGDHADPGYIVDEDGNRYLYMSGGYITKLSDNGLSTVGEMVENYSGWQYPEEWITECFCLESPKSTIKNGYDYMVVAARSKSPYGPFKYHGTFFDNDSRNSHHSIIKIRDKRYLFYHVEDASPFERIVCVDYLSYNPDGTIKEVNMTKEGIEPIK